MREISLGLKENWKQFSLLVFINALVGAMIGVERSVFPEYASQRFEIDGHSAFLSFILVFGLSKAIANYNVGRFSGKYGRKKMLIIGWSVVLPVPLILMYANHWWMVIFANMLLGISQGFTWSSTVIMKIDLVGPKNRGLAMGLNEFAGYASVGLMALVTGWIAGEYSITPYVFIVALVIALMGLVSSVVLIKDTRSHMSHEAGQSELKKLRNIIVDTTFRNKTLSAVTQAGLVNNMNDGMLWGLLPVILYSQGYNDEWIGLIIFIYPFVWGVGQLFTGKMADHFNVKRMLFLGMLMQGVAILIMVYTPHFWSYVFTSIVLGIGTALVYPTFFTAISRVVHPDQRAESIGVFRFWRDGGYAVGALLSGVLADLFNIETAVIATGLITILSAFVIKLRMKSFVSL